MPALQRRNILILGNETVHPRLVLGSIFALSALPLRDTVPSYRAASML